MGRHGLFKFMQCYKFVACLYLLMPIVYVVSLAYFRKQSTFKQLLISFATPCRCFRHFWPLFWWEGVTWSRPGEIRSTYNKIASSWDIDIEECTGDVLQKLLISSTTRLFCTDRSLRVMFPELTKLSTVAALVPVSMAECERAFSAMKRIKT